MPKNTMIHQVAEVIGEEALEKLLKAVGGRRVHVPARAGASHYITKIIGQEGADKLCAHFDNCRIDLPLQAKKRALIVEALAAGVPKTEIAQKYFVTERHVYYIQAEQAAPVDDKQGRLF